MPEPRRRRALARRSNQNDEERVEYLSFAVAADVYAVPVSRIREILRPPPVTVVPRAPSFVRGVVSVRGQLVTTIDLRRRIGLPDGPPNRRSRILLVEAPARPPHPPETIGVFVDEVLHVYRLSAGELEPTAALGSDQRGRVVGIARPEGATNAEVIGVERPLPSGVRAEDALLLLLLDLDAILNW